MLLASNLAHMARRRKKRAVRPRAPARVRKAKRTKKARGHQHPELVGLVLAALGLFLATVVYLDWSGGQVGGWLADALESVIGGAVYALPLGLIAVGSLMLGRSDLVDVRPFRTGLMVSTFGLMLTLGNHGGSLGRGLHSIFGALVGSTGAALAGGTALAAGGLLLTGASAGALLRRGATVARRSLDRPPRPEVADEPPELISTANASPQALVDAASEYPDVIGMAEPAPLIPFPEPDTQDSADHESLFNASPAVQDYRLPDRTLLRKSGKKGNVTTEASGQIAEALVQALGDFGV